MDSYAQPMFREKRTRRIIRRLAPSMLSLAILLIAFTVRATDLPSSNWIQLSPGTSPTARSYFAIAYDVTSRRVIMFGGDSGTDYLNDTWSFDGATWTKVETPIAPPARTNAQMAYDRRAHKIILFGGYDGAHYLGDTWIWDGDRKS